MLFCFQGVVVSTIYLNSLADAYRIKVTTAFLDPSPFVEIITMLEG